MLNRVLRCGLRLPRPLCGLLSLSLLLLLTACASAPPPAVSPVKCVHPEIDPYTNSGLTLAVQAYGEALDLCNALNGFTLTEMEKN